eukprot:4964458-Alexandrium_andersonii.AAC.1
MVPPCSDQPVQLPARVPADTPAASVSHGSQGVEASARSVFRPSPATLKPLAPSAPAAPAPPQGPLPQHVLQDPRTVSYTHLRAHETSAHL